jgi:hypothetical protein
MKLIYFIFISIIILSLSSCDSPTDSKATNVNAPSLISPPNNDTLPTFTPTFKWSGLADKFQISLYPSFNTLFYSVNVSDSQYTLPGNVLTLHHQMYYWHAGKTSGGTTYWAELTYRFVTW